LSAYCKIEVYSHHFVVSKMTPRLHPLMRETLTPLVEWAGFRSRGKFHREAKRTFAASNSARSYVRLHINLYPEFMQRLKNAGITENLVDIIHKRMYTPKDMVYIIPPKWVPREDQPRVIRYMTDPGKSKVVTLQTGKGKAQPLSSRIRVPNGWLTMGEMEIGTNVLTPSGGVANVKAIHPQGTIDVYEVTFSDDRSTRCCKDHLWKVHTIQSGWVVVSLEAIIAARALTPSSKVSVPLTGTLNDKVVDLPIPPYTLGALLSSESTWGYDEYSESINALNITNKLDSASYVPKLYLTSSHIQRRAVLQGLLDTSCTINKYETITFKCKGKQLALDVQELARSLGCWAKLTRVWNRYILKIRSAEPEKLFRSRAGKEKVSNLSEFSKGLKLTIKDIRRVGSEESQCIELNDVDKLYITNDYIVTHNTFCALKAAEVLGTLTAFQMGGKYIDKWVGDIQEAYQLSKKDICVVRGAKALKNVINLAIAGEFNYKTIIFSTTTLLLFYKAYEEGKLRGYLIKPVDLWRTLGIGLRVVDEAHENQHALFKMDLYAHIPKTIFLSATIKPDSDFRMRMVGIQWPPEMRFKEGDYDRYVRVRSVYYDLYEPERIRHVNQQKMYSHVLFEESIMKKPIYIAQYLGVIDAMVYKWYSSRRDDGYKCLVLAATTEMCGVIAQYLAKTNPTLEVSRYVAEDDYDVLMESDISVSTIQSAGTGVDIPNLRYCLMTTAISSSQANLQAVGRLRKITDDPESHLYFDYLVARNIPKHVEYHEKKITLLRSRALSITELRTGIEVGKE